MTSLPAQCPHCGAPTDPGVPSCANCGSALDATESLEPPQSESAVPDASATEALAPIEALPSQDFPVPELGSATDPAAAQPTPGMSATAPSYASPPPGPPTRRAAIGRFQWIGIGCGSLFVLLFLVGLVIGVVSAIVGGSDGTIDFGSSFSSGKIHIVGKHNTFKPGQEFAFVASLNDKAGASHLTWILSRVGPKGTRIVLHRQSFHVKNQKDNIFARRLPVTTLMTLGLSRTGTYDLRIQRGSTVLAKGTFKFVKPHTGQSV